MRMNYRTEPFRDNPNVALATTKHGGHFAAQESYSRYHVWAIEPVVKFFSAYADSTEVVI